MVRALSSRLRGLIDRYRFHKEFHYFRKHSISRRFLVKWSDRRPFLTDKTNVTGFDRHYVYHTAWAARIIKQLNPDVHIDIGSCLRFVSTLSAFVPVRFYDYRPAELYLDNLKCGSADLTRLPFASGSITSLSCMHVVEHIGLGRYGDFLDVDGDLNAIEELKRVVAVGGYLLFVVPIGKAKIIFNAHRIYSYDQVMSYFNSLELIEFTLIPDQSDKGLIVNATREDSDSQSYGCGCFMFKKGQR